MADLAASDVALSYNKGDRTFAGITPLNLITLKVGDGTKNYPATGYIPLPTDNTLYGLAPNNGVNAMMVMVPPADGNVYRVDVTNMRLYIYQCAGAGAAMQVMGNSALAAKTLVLLVFGKQ